MSRPVFTSLGVLLLCFLAFLSSCASTTTTTVGVTTNQAPPRPELGR